MSISKTIHYCWFGNKKKPKLVRECIASWHTVLPDYKIKEWNETNVDLTNSFVEYAYKHKKWAFVSDYVRLEILYAHGGIYLDTDMLFLKPIDDFLENGFFIGAEEERFISCGIIGSISKHPFIKKCIESYDDISLESIEFDKITMPKILTSNFRSYYDYQGKFDGALKFEEVLICPKNYFYPYSYDDSETNSQYLDFVTPDTYAIHLWNKSWIDHSEFYYYKKGCYYRGFVTSMINLYKGNKSLNKQYVKMLAYSIKKSFRKK